MPESDQEVFEHFRADYSGNREIALLAYAGYAQAKYDWVNHQLAKRGQAPSENEVARWIADLPNSRLAEIYERAITTFKDAAEHYMKPTMEKERTEAVERAVSAEIREMLRRVERVSSFKMTFLPNLFTGIVASFAFALIVLVAAVIYQHDPSVFALSKRPFRNHGGMFVVRGWMAGPDVIPGRCSKPCRRSYVDADHPCAA
jgi:hypothetical protein